MTKFNPNDLTKNISDEVKEAHMREAREDGEAATLEYIAKCKTEGDEGQTRLAVAAASTLAVNLHCEMCRLLCNSEDNKSFMKPLADMFAASRGKDLILASAFLAVGKAVIESYLDDGKKKAEAGDIIGALSDCEKGKRLATDAMQLADLVRPIFLSAIENLGNGVNVATGNGFDMTAYFTKPDTKTTPPDTTKH